MYERGCNPSFGTSYRLSARPVEATC